MNEGGHPATLRSAQPGNRSALKTGVYSARARAERAAEMRAAAAEVSTFELVVAAVRDERSRLDDLRKALDADIAEHGLSTRSGAAREQFARRSSVVSQLRTLYATWATGELIEVADIYDVMDRDPAAGALRDELLGLLALRDLLDLDLKHRGVSTRKGGLRRQVAQRVGVSRELVRLADRIRTAARRARNTVGPLSRWEVASEIAFDSSQRPSGAIKAIEYLLMHPRTPASALPERLAWAAEPHALSTEELHAAGKEVEALVLEEAASAPTNENPSADPNALSTRCLEVLQRIAGGADPRATARDRMHAAELRERHVPLVSLRRLRAHRTSPQPRDGGRR